MDFCRSRLTFRHTTVTQSCFELAYTFVCLFILLFVCFCGVLVFVITKTKTPKFTAKCDLKLCAKDRTEDNLTD